MNEYIVTIGFNSEDGYEVIKSNPIPAKSDTKACEIIREQFEMYEGQRCDIIQVIENKQ